MSAKELEFFSDLFYKSKNFSLVADTLYDFKLTNTDNDSLFVYEEYQVGTSKFLVEMNENVRSFSNIQFFLKKNIF